MVAIIGAIVLALVLCGGLVFALGQRSALSKILGALTPDTASVAKTRVALNPQDALAHVQLGDEYARQKNYDVAYAEYDRAIKLNAKFSHAYAQAGELATTLGDFERASKYFTQRGAASRRMT